MKKVLSAILVIALTGMLFAGCTPAQTAEPTKAPEETPEATPDTTPEATPADPFEELYTSALELFNSGDYAAAKKTFKKISNWKKYKDVADLVEQCDEKIKDADYAAAELLVEQGKIKEAIQAFRLLMGYRDSKQRADDLQNQLYGKIYNETKVGSSYFFGRYEQDNNPENGAEEIEWIIAGKQDGKFLLVSKYALFPMAYDTTGEDVTWENSELRKYLNSQFIKDAFSGEEQTKLVKTLVTAADDISGNDTLDWVFILSMIEADTFLSKDQRQVYPTEYALALGTQINADNKHCWWWLRNHGTLGALRQAICYTIGDTEGTGHDFNTAERGIVPAIWITASELGPEVGEIILYGYYEQDNNIENGDEPIEWVILDKTDGALLLNAAYALFPMAFDTTGNIVTWETSEIRAYLNSTFIADAFDGIDYRIVETTNEPDNEKSGNTTVDKVFLLSVNEIFKYIKTDPLKQRYPTEYAYAQGTAISDSNQHCWWWTRNIGDVGEETAVVVYSIGEIDTGGGHRFNTPERGVVPSLRITY